MDWMLEHFLTCGSCDSEMKKATNNCMDCEHRPIEDDEE